MKKTTKRGGRKVYWAIVSKDNIVSDDDSTRIAVFETRLQAMWNKSMFDPTDWKIIPVYIIPAPKSSSPD